MRRTWLGAWWMVLAAAAAIGAPVAPPASAPATGKAVTLEPLVRTRIQDALKALDADGDYDKARQSLQATFDLVIARAGDKQPDLFREADFALRLVTQVAQVDAERRPALLKLLRRNDNLAHTLVFLVRPDERVTDIYKLLDRLSEERGGMAGEQLDQYATLVAAICVVHQKPFTRQINENETKAADPVALYDYFSKNEAAMYFGIRNVPAELLVYVVDTTASVEDMKWALAKYPKDPMVGKHFFDVPYDYAAFREGAEKKVDAGAYTLPNILKLGGVCADQAFFAMSIGKAIGVPTAYATAVSGEAGHAWVGFLQAQGNQGWWNFDVGRYPQYHGIRGNVMEPQTHQRIPDAYVSLLGELIGTKPADRQVAVAYTDAAQRLIVLEHAGEELAPATTPDLTGTANYRPAPRKAVATEALDLLQAGLTYSVAYRPAWFTVCALAKDGKLTIEQKRKWSDVVLKLCGQKYPDFGLTVLAPMIESVEDPKEQDRIWQGAFAVFQSRADLAAYILMTRGKLWEDNKDVAKAGECYTAVVEKYANAGPFVLGALEAAERLLRASGKADRVPTLYETTWPKIARPVGMAGTIMTQSNWYQVGKLLAARLEEAGQTQKATAVKAQLDAVVGKPK